MRSNAVIFLNGVQLLDKNCDIEIMKKIDIMKTVHKLIKEGKDETIFEDLLKSVDVTGGKRAGECWGILGNKYARTPDVMDKLWKKIQKSIIKTDEKSKDGDFCRVFWGFLEMERKTQHHLDDWEKNKL